jgi:hypothetical protein
LYGHPESGACWERHCYERLRAAGYKDVPDWPGVFFHDALKLLLIVYVDDFKLAGPAKNMDKGWGLIRKDILMGEPEPAGKYSGCMHFFEDITIDGPKGPRSARRVVYDMEDFLGQCVSRYLELADDPHLKLRKVNAPFVDETQDENSVAVQDGSSAPTGRLQPIACRVLMKLLYAARMARFDLLRATCALATMITKWSPECDRRLHRLVCYVDSSLKHRQVSVVTDRPEDLSLELFCDADFASDKASRRSTSGVYLRLCGPEGSRAGLTGVSKKQSCISTSTPEAEMVALGTPGKGGGRALKKADV